MLQSTTKALVDYKVQWKGGCEIVIQNTKGIKKDLIVDSWRDGDAVTQEEGLEGHCSRPPLLLLLLLAF